MTNGEQAHIAWRHWCERLLAMGDRIMDEDFPGDDRDRIEGFRHLATQTMGWTAWAVGHPDPAFPAFWRQNDLVMCWGGPNVDQVTRRARIDPALTYRITGELGACEDFILTLKNGDMHAGKYGIGHEVMASELGFSAGDHIEILLSAEPCDGVWVPIPADATMLNLREYYWNWMPRPPAVFTIECIESRGSSPAPLTADGFDEMLNESAGLIESSVTYWNEWVESERAKVPVNTMGPPAGSAGGSSRIRYSFGFTDLAPDEALLITVDPVDATYRDIQLYSLGWFESLDFGNRTTSLNHTQDTISSDGLVRFVLSSTDPAVPNWLDCEGRRSVMCTQRWIKVTDEPVISSEVIKVADVRDFLPADTPVVTDAERREENAARQAHIAWRYRT